jgi:hypothetical protein
LLNIGLILFPKFGLAGFHANQNNMTTDSQRQKAQAVVADMVAVPGVEKTQVDDWDDRGGFNIFVQLKREPDSSQFIKFVVPLAGIVAKLKAIVAKHGSIWEWHEPPRREYSWAGPRQPKYWNGCNTDSYKLSLRVP